MADVSYSSITPSSASYASSVFPVLDGPTFELVDSIISRVAAGASDWKPVLQAYRDEFRARGIDGDTDTAVYGLLLRLGMERGGDWRSKWEGIQSQQQSNVDAAAAKTPKAPVDIAKSDVFRRLQDAPAQPKTPIQPIKQQHRLPQALTREALDKLQSTSSPYKKSYQTPRAAGYATPAEITTPIVPRVHFASSEVSLHKEHAHIDPATTPEGKEAMLKQAIRFDRLVLLGRMMDDWLSRMAVLQKLDEHTELARNALLARRSIHVWQDRVVRHRDLLETAGRAHNAAAKRRCLNNWRDKAEQKQKARWEKQMHIAYRTVARKQEKEIKSSVLSHWFEKMLNTRCERFRKTTLLRTCLTRWLSRSAHLAEREAGADTILERKNTFLLQKSLETWYSKSVLLRREEAFLDQADLRLCSAAFASWRERAYERQISEEILAVTTLRLSFGRWKARLAHVRSFSTQAESFAQSAGKALLRNSFHTWKIAEHGKLLLHARKSRILRRSLTIWRARTRHHAVVHAQQADAFRRQGDIARARSSLTRWQARLSDRQKAVHLAASLSNRLVLQRSFRSWRKAGSAHRLEARKAQVARDFFVQRSALHAWHKKMKNRKAAAWVEDRRKRVLREVFDAWRDGARRSIRDAALVHGFYAALDQRLLHSALRTWTDRVIDIRARELSVSTNRANELVSKAFARWRSLTARHAEDLSLVDSFVEVQDEQLGKRYFRRWLVRTRKEKALKQLLEEKLEEDKRNLLAGCYERWTDRFHENQLLAEEEEVLAYRQQQALVIMFSRWKSRTMTLPAIRFDSERLKRAALYAWHTALPDKINGNRAVAFRDEKLLSATFSIWDEARRAKVARRAANRFRAFSANGNRPRASPAVAQRAIGHRAQSSSPVIPRLAPPAATPAAPASASRLYDSRPPVVAAFRGPATSTPTKTQSHLFSAASLRRELSSRSPRPSASKLRPEAVALPPASSASAVSDASPSASRRGTVGDDSRQPERRSHSRSRSQTDDGILREMRERLAAVGLVDGRPKSRHAA